MAGFTERLRFIIDASTQGARSEVGKLQKDMVALEKQPGKVQTAFKGAGGAIKGFVAGFGALAAADFLGNATKQAIDFQETVSKTNQVFESNSKAIKDWAEGAADDFGQSKADALTAASTFGNLFSQLGFGADETARLSTEMTELASDFASFHNANPVQVIEAMTAAFRGEFDALQRFVPTITAAAVEQKAMAQTGKDNAASLTAQEKAAATTAIVFEEAGDALGDFDRTSDSAANQLRKLNAEWENMQIALGEQALPVLTSALGVLTDINDIAEDLKGLNFGSLFGGLTSGLENILTFPGKIPALGTAFKVARGPIGFAAEQTSRLALNLGETALGWAGFNRGASEAEKIMAPLAASIGPHGAAGAMHAFREETAKARDESAALAPAAQAAADAIAGIEEAAQGTKDALLGLFDAEIAARDATRQVEEAGGELVTMLDNSETALSDVAVAQDNFRSEALTAAAAAEKLAKDNATLAGKSFTAADGAAAQRGALENLANKFPELRPLIQGYIDKLDQIPQTRNTNVNASGNAFDRVRELLRQLANLAGSSYTADVNVSLDRHHKGGIVPGNPGTEHLAMVQAGERIIPTHQVHSSGGNGHGGPTINLVVNAGMGVNGQQVGREIVQHVSQYLRGGGRLPW